jgi:hypothetical protein
MIEENLRVMEMLDHFIFLVEMHRRDLVSYFQSSRSDREVSREYIVSLGAELKTSLAEEGPARAVSEILLFVNRLAQCSSRWSFVDFPSGDPEIVKMEIKKRIKYLQSFVVQMFHS